MTAAQIHRAVSRATGESVREIRRMGFSLANSLNIDEDSEDGDHRPQMIDWDQQEAIRSGQHC